MTTLIVSDAGAFLAKERAGGKVQIVVMMSDRCLVWRCSPRKMACLWWPSKSGRVGMLGYRWTACNYWRRRKVLRGSRGQYEVLKYNTGDSYGTANRIQSPSRGGVKLAKLMLHGMETAETRQWRKGSGKVKTTGEMFAARNRSLVVAPRRERGLVMKCARERWSVGGIICGPHNMFLGVSGSLLCRSCSGVAWLGGVTSCGCGVTPRPSRPLEASERKPDEDLKHVKPSRAGLLSREGLIRDNGRAGAAT